MKNKAFIIILWLIVSIPEQFGFKLKAYFKRERRIAENITNEIPEAYSNPSLRSQDFADKNFSTTDKYSINYTEETQPLAPNLKAAALLKKEPTLTTERMEALGKSSFRVEEWLKQLEESGYNYATPPGLLQNKPTTVGAEIFVESLGNFQPSTMDYDTDIYFAEEWTDLRLRHNLSDKVAFNKRAHLTRIWQPDTYFANSKMARYNEVTVPNLIIWIWPDGRVRMNVRINIKVSCNMNLRAYPLDAQECFLKILPYGSNASKVFMKWLSDSPIQINDEIHEADLELIGWKTISYFATYYQSNYTCLKAIFFLRRTIGQSLLQVYAPTIAIVMISWISFWIDPTSVPGRTGLCVTTLLTLSTQAAGISFRLPPVGYAKALDVWLSVCMMFLFGSLIEFTVVNTYTRKWMNYSAEKHVGNKSSDVQKTTIGNPNLLSPPTLVLNDNGELLNFIEQRAKAEFCTMYKSKALRIDKISRIAFPVCFGIFVIVYVIIFTIGRRNNPMF